MADRTVFVLMHECEQRGRDDSKMIGVYASRQDAEAAILRPRSAPGFRDWPDDFSIDEYQLGRDHWTEGFTKIVPILVPLADSQVAEGMECVHAAWMPGDRFQILEDRDGDSDTRLIFGPGQVVRCEERTIDGVAGCLVAVEAID